MPCQLGDISLKLQGKGVGDSFEVGDGREFRGWEDWNEEQ